MYKRQPGTGEYVAWIGDQGYTSLVDAVKAAKKGETTTITLGEGSYTLYNIPSTDTTKGKDLTFVGQGTDKTTWQIGPTVPNPALFGTEYNSDYSFQGAGTVTFKNMKLCTGSKDYLGFTYIDNTVVDHCEIYGKTFYWGYTSAVFTDTTFYAPTGDYALWTYCSPTMTFDTCTFNTTGKAIYVHTDGTKQDITVYFNNCTVNSELMLNKTAMKIDDSNMGSYKYIININDPQTIDAARDTMTCSKVFGFDGKSACNTGRTEVYWNDSVEPVWKDGKMQTHSYTDGEHDKAFTYTYSKWTKFDERNEWRDVTKTCDYCHRLLEKHQETASVYRLQYNLNEGVGAENADYNDAYSREKESVKLEAAPTREGYQFAGWLSLNGKLYKAGSELVLTGDEVFTAQWKKDEPVVNHTLTVTGGTFAVKDGDIDVTDTLETSTDETSGKQTCLVPDLSLIHI